LYDEHLADILVDQSDEYEPGRGAYHSRMIAADELTFFYRLWLMRAKNISFSK